MKRFALLLALPACLSVPSEEEPMCEVTADCDHANGEICDDGICWGNPPAGMFSAIVSPPSSRTSLVSQEIPNLVINQDGWIDQLTVPKPLAYTAKLACQAPMTCEDALLDATITVTRAPRFPGGPGFRSVIKTQDGQAFTINVPPVDGYASAPYTITIVPDNREEMSASRTPAQLLPPLRTQLTIESSASGKLIELGGIGLPIISGVIKDANGAPQSNYRVVALGRWDLSSTPTEVSTVDFTGSDGTFSIQLSGGLTSKVELVARPVVTQTRPTLRYAAEVAQTGMQNLTLQWPQGVGSPAMLDIPVTAVDGNGVVKEVRGARVIVSSKVPAAMGVASYVAEAVTNEAGRAQLAVLDGPAFAGSYRISILPQASSTAGVMYDQTFSILAPIPPKQLGTRVALRGIVALGGAGVKDMSITARPSLRFLWSLDPDDQQFLSSIPPSTTVTPESGEFVVWVDPKLAGIPGYYDLVLEAASGSRAPNAVITGVVAPTTSNQAELDVNVYDLPFPAYVRSKIIDDKGMDLEGAELKLFKTEDFATLCLEVSHPPMNCVAAATMATLMGRGASDSDGEVRLTLPR